MSDFTQDLIADLRANNGEATSGPFVGRQMIILTTTGAKTGETRVTPLVYSTDGDDVIIVASKGGAPSHPAWYHNLVAEPHVTVEVAGERYDAHATVADPAERRRLYDQHAELHPGFTEYETKTDRVIPVIVLRRDAAEAQGAA
jgi:deazaflavin-dependent oxidoreductase (nitroreductase family)